MSEKKFYYKYESVFDHNITEKEWELLDTGFDFVNKDQYLRYVVKRPTSGYWDIRCLYARIRKEPEKAKKYMNAPDIDMLDYWDLSL